MKKITFPEGGEYYGYTNAKKINDFNLTVEPYEHIEAEEFEVEDLDLAEIDYVVEGGNVRIKELRNFFSAGEIREKYGEDIAEEYWNKNPSIGVYRDGKMLGVYSDDWGCYINKGEKIDRKQFSEAVKIMKKAGNRLHNIIQSHKNKEIRTVKI